MASLGMLSRLGGEALEKIQATKNAAKNCLNHALGYTEKPTEAEKGPKEPPNRAAKRENMELSMLFKRDTAYEEELATVDVEDDEDLVLITHQSCSLKIQKKLSLPPPEGEQKQFQKLQLGDDRFEEVSLE